MAKKHLRTKNSPRIPHGLFFYVHRSILLFCISLVFFTLASRILQANQIPPTCANSQSCASDLSIKIENKTPGIFHGHKVSPPQIFPALEHTLPGVLGENTLTGEKHIYVDLSAQTLVAYQGNTQVLKTFISSGKWGKTPTGNFHIWEKLLATRMAGGEGADAYDLPNVPYVMYFYHDFGLHGAYWHDNFGHTMSHGCVNMRAVDAKALYSWVDGPTHDSLGKVVSICDQVTNNHQCIQSNPID